MNFIMFYFEQKATRTAKPVAEYIKNISLRPSIQNILCQRRGVCNRTGLFIKIPHTVPRPYSL